MPDTQAPARVAYLRFVDDGLTFEGQVWRAGAVTQTTDIEFASVDPTTQRQRWGVVMFELIPEEEYLALRDIPAQNLRATRRATATPPPPATGYNANGEPTAYDPGKAQALGTAPEAMSPILLVDDPKKTAQYGLDALNEGAPPPPPEPAAGTVANMPPPAVPEPWPWYADASDMETISHIAGMGESTVQDFLSYERANRNRPGIIKIITTGEM